MVRKMVNEEQKLSQSQGSNSSQEAPSSSQEVLSTMQQIPSSQESQQLPGETKTGAGWMIRLTEETFRKETGDGGEVPPAEDLNTKRSKSFVYGQLSQLSPEVGACPLQTEENSAVQLASSDLAFLPSLLSVVTEETAQAQSGPLSPELPPATPFKAPGPQCFTCVKCGVICNHITSYRNHLLTHYYRYSSDSKLYKYYHDILIFNCLELSMIMFPLLSPSTVPFAISHQGRGKMR